jgi:uncharacterized membrane protein
MDELYGTFVARWYVSLFGLVYCWCAIRHLGWRRTLLYTAAAVGVGVAFENGSVNAGLPYTTYTFNPDLRGEEIFVGDVPLAVPLSYTFLGYFAFVSGRLVASSPWRTRAPRLWHEYLLGVVLSVWALWILDPVSRLGNRWFLGELFEYRGPGFWFGLPLGSQAGFTLTAALLVGLLTWMARHDADVAVARPLAHPHVPALLTYHGQVLMMATVAIALGETEVGVAGFLIWVPAAAITAVLWSTVRPVRAAAVTTSEALTADVRDPVPARERVLLGR